MLFVAFIISLYFIPHIHSVKLKIDGTIDLGSNWNFEYKMQPLRSFDSGNIISKTRDVTREERATNNGDTKIDEDSKDGINVDDDNGYVARTQDLVKSWTAMDDKYDTNEQEFFVTQLYKTDHGKSKDTFYSETPRRIKDDGKLVEFILNINDTSVYVFYVILKKAKVDSMKDKINTLKNRFIEKFGKFVNETKEHHIKTKLGTKRVLINVVDYSYKLMQRLANRLIIDTKDSELKREESVATKFRKEIEKLRASGYQKACREFRICRTGREFSNFVSDTIKTLLSADDEKLQQSIQALTRELKDANFSKIMDDISERLFKGMLTVMEEMSSLELRFLLTGYVFLIENKNLPFSEKNIDPNWIQKVIVIFKIIDRFDEAMEMSEDNKDWGDHVKINLDKWVKGTGEDVTGITKEFVQHIQEGIAKLDHEAANDLKSDFHTLMLMSLKPQIDHRYNVPFQIMAYI